LAAQTTEEHAKKSPSIQCVSERTCEYWRALDGPASAATAANLCAIV
jgi:hypothetical protein